MSSAGTTRVLDRVLDPVADCLPPEVAQRIANLQLDPMVQARLDELAQKAKEGSLTSSERREYEEYVEGIDILGILQAKARLSLLRRSGEFDPREYYPAIDKVMAEEDMDDPLLDSYQ